MIFFSEKNNIFYLIKTITTALKKIKIVFFPLNTNYITVLECEKQKSTYNIFLDKIVYVKWFYTRENYIQYNSLYNIYN